MVKALEVELLVIVNVFLFMILFHFIMQAVTVHISAAVSAAMGQWFKAKMTFLQDLSKADVGEQAKQVGRRESFN